LITGIIDEINNHIFEHDDPDSDIESDITPYVRMHLLKEGPSRKLEQISTDTVALSRGMQRK
jgi:hypothetical protein